MMLRLLHLLSIVLALVTVGSSEFCKIQSSKYCFDYCCANRTTEYCCPYCHRSVHIDNHPFCSESTSFPPLKVSWWVDNGWWVEILLRVGLPLGFFLVGGIIILALVCAGKINLDRVFGRHRRPQPMQVPPQVVGAANQPPSYAQATGASYPVQPASACVVQTTTTTTTYPIQQTTATAPGAYPMQQPPPYTMTPGGNYPPQQAYPVNYPLLAENPNYPPTESTHK